MSAVKKLVAEDLYEGVSFVRGADPKSVLNIGRRAKIREWFESIEFSPDEYTINSDLSIHVKGNLDLRRTSVTELPEGLSVGGWLDLQGSPIRKLPKGLSVGGALILNETPITELPEGLSVGGNLNLRATSIVKLPEDIRVGGYLNLRGSLITELPQSLRNRKNVIKDF